VPKLKGELKTFGTSDLKHIHYTTRTMTLERRTDCFLFELHQDHARCCSGIT